MQQSPVAAVGIALAAGLAALWYFRQSKTPRQRQNRDAIIEGWFEFLFHHSVCRHKDDRSKGEPTQIRFRIMHVVLLWSHLTILNRFDNVRSRPAEKTLDIEELHDRRHHLPFNTNILSSTSTSREVTDQAHAATPVRIYPWSWR